MGDTGDSALESEFFDVDPQRGIQITLMANEVVFIPFVFVSLEPRGKTPPPSISESSRKAPARRSGAATPGADPLRGRGEGGAGSAERSVVVAFVSASHGHVVSMMQVIWLRALVGFGRRE